MVATSITIAPSIFRIPKTVDGQEQEGVEGRDVSP